MDLKVYWIGALGGIFPLLDFGGILAWKISTWIRLGLGGFSRNHREN